MLSMNRNMKFINNRWCTMQMTLCHSIQAIHVDVGFDTMLLTKQNG
jgi:hypothetical protein